MEAAVGHYDIPCSNLLDQYRRVWELAGTKGDKVKKIEHLVLLLDALTFTDEPVANQLRSGLETVEKGVEKIVQM